MKIIDGKQTSQDIREEIKSEIEALKVSTESVPGLAVVQVGQNPASKVYVNSKVRTCEALGLHSEKYLLDKDVSQDELIGLIQRLNENDDIDGILVQLPLPKHIDEKVVTETISIEKDVDGFEDDDGCPEVDNDNDTIPDAVDSCPMIHEDMDDYQDDDGCPEEGPGKPTVKITDTQLLISSKIYFDYDKATIKEVCYPILDAVAEALEANPHIKKIQVEGHTDNEGTEEYNHALSESRAKAVMEYLIGKQIPKERLTYKGYGFSRPKASNETEEGKAINRRVEFTIIHGD